MAMYDNLLANVPTDLWIGGKWRKGSDGARFDVIDPATENKIASVASASVEDAKAAIDAAQARSTAGRPRSRASAREILRKAFELIVRDAERFAKLITIENGKALSDRRARCSIAPSSSAGTPRRRCAISASSTCARLGARMWCSTSRPASPCW
jgi:succinate-semialdehyde dehydrogenase/glutarate-semialdehyde dehydrogenase